MAGEDIRKVVKRRDTVLKLRKAGIKSLSDVRKLTPRQLMELSSIGPETTRKLYAAIGQRLDVKELEKTYYSMKSRTRFHNIQLHDWIKRVNMERTTEILQGVRGGAIAIQKMAGIVSGLGKPGDKTFYSGPKELTYEQLLETINQRVRGVPESKINSFLVEFRVDAKFKDDIHEGYHLDWVIERGTNNKIEDSGQFFSPEPDSAQKIMRFIKRKIEDWRKKDKRARIFLILTNDANEFLTETGEIRTVYLPEYKLDEHFFIFIDHEWEKNKIRQKYDNNTYYKKTILTMDDFILQLRYYEQKPDQSYTGFKEEWLEAHDNKGPWKLSARAYLEEPTIGMVWGIVNSFPNVNISGYTKQVFASLPPLAARKPRNGRLDLYKGLVSIGPAKVDLLGLVFTALSFDERVRYYENPKDGVGRVLVRYERLPDIGALLEKPVIGR